jgi:heme-degrading monooxygenase HmoA
MIERHWSAIARREKADEYIDYLNKNTFEKLKSLPGFATAKILTRETAEGIEFLIITTWENIKAIENFAGKNVTRSVVPEPVQKLMLRFDSEARHYEVREN